MTCPLNHVSNTGIENEKELDDLTEFNTAHNKRVVIATTGDKTEQRKRKQSESGRISFNEEHEIINPEDVDPSIGRFRNMISSSIVIESEVSIYIIIILSFLFVFCLSAHILRIAGGQDKIK